MPQLAGLIDCPPATVTCRGALLGRKEATLDLASRSASLPPRRSPGCCCICAADSHWQAAVPILLAAGAGGDLQCLARGWRPASTGGAMSNDVGLSLVAMFNLFCEIIVLAGTRGPHLPKLSGAAPRHSSHSSIDVTDAQGGRRGGCRAAGRWPSARRRQQQTKAAHAHQGAQASAPQPLCAPAARGGQHPDRRRGGSSWQRRRRCRWAHCCCSFLQR